MGAAPGSLAAARARPLIVTGASGFLGRHVLGRLVPVWQAEARAVVRREASAGAAGAHTICGDLRDEQFLDRAIPRGGVVVHLAYDGAAGRDVNLLMADRLGEACARAGVERLVHVSTAVVVGRCDEPWVTESTPARPVTEYQRAKLAVEETLKRHAKGRFPLVILRPTAIFGEGGANLRVLVRRLRQNSMLANYFRSSLSNRRAMNLVPVDTVAAAVQFGLESAQALEDGLYLVSEDEVAANNFHDVERTLRSGLGMRDYPVPPLPLPASGLAVALRLTGRMALHPMTRFSAGRLRRAGFVAPITFSDALARYSRHVATGSGRSEA